MQLKGKLTDIKDSLEPGDIILYGPGKGGGPIGAAFRAGSEKLQGKFTHSGIYVGDGKSVESFMGRKIKEYDVKLDREVTILRPKLSKKTRDKAVRFAKEQVGKPYSVKDLALHAKSLLLPREAKKFVKGNKNTDAYSCSTLVTRSYQNAGARVVNTSVDVAAPVDLVSSAKNKIVFSTSRPDEKITITDSGKRAARKVQKFLDKNNPLEKLSSSVSYTQSQTYENIDGAVNFSGKRRVTRNGKSSGVKYRGYQFKGKPLALMVEKMAGVSLSQLNQYSAPVGNAYTWGRSAQSAHLEENYERARKTTSKVSKLSKKKYEEYRRRGFRKTASAQEIFSNGRLQILSHPEAYKWMPPRDIIEKLGQFMHKEMCIRIFPRDMIFEVYNSEHPTCLGEDDYYKFRAYTSGTKATVFVDETETADSVLWVILHELAHMDMKASSYLYKAYTWATPEDYNESDEAHERDPEEQMANLVATKWLGKLGREEFCYSRPWWRSRVEAHCSMEKDAANVIALAAGVAAGTVAVYDYFKSRGMGLAAKTVEEEMGKNQVNTKQYLRKKDPRITAVTSFAEAKGLLAEIKTPEDKDAVKRQLQAFFSSGESNAFAFRGKKGEYVVAHPKCSKITLDHEIGHIHDFRSQNLNMLGEHKYNRNPLKQFLFKKHYRAGTYQGEVAAWDRAKVPEKHRLRTAALDTYDKSFHKNRMAVAAPTAVGLLLYGAK